MNEQDKYQESAGGEAAPAPSKPVEPAPSVEPKPVGGPAEQPVQPEQAAPAAPAAPPASGPAGSSGNQAQVKALCDIAFDKGLDTAIEEAKKLNSPYILDEFHDALVDELYKKMVEAGKLEQK